METKYLKNPGVEADTMKLIYLIKSHQPSVIKCNSNIWENSAVEFGKRNSKAWKKFDKKELIFEKT